MKRLFLLVLMIFVAPNLFARQLGIYQQGTVVRMHLGDCNSMHRGFRATMSGESAQGAGLDACPEYTLVADKVVYVVVGKSKGQLIPLAEAIDFRFKENELAVRIDDGGRETNFNIKEMVLRSEWERSERLHQNSVATPSSADGPAASQPGQ